LPAVRIIYFSPHPTHDIVSEVGYSTHQRETIKAFRNLGHEVLPVILGGTTTDEKKHFSSNHSRHKLKEVIKKLLPDYIFNLLKDLKIRRFDKLAAYRLQEAVDSFKPDLVYERSEYMQDSGTRICSKVGIPHFLEVNAPFIEEMRLWEGKSLLHPFGHALEKRKIHAASKVFAVSSVLRDFLAKRYKYPPEKISVIPNCIDPDSVIINDAQTEALRLNWKLEGKQVIGFVGSFFPHHGIDDLIHAFAQIEQDFPDAVLFIVGGGMNEEGLRRKAADLLGPKRVIFAGRVPHNKVYQYISLMDITVMPKSNWYGSPMKIFEYGILGKAIIAPDNGPVNDVMSHNKDGYLVQSGVESLAGALSYFLANPELREQLGSHFKKKILQHYTWKQQAAYILSHFE
jgi:glycosyltransferase involved in cell wall biosynthesis